jgi:hypothetical protein
LPEPARCFQGSPAGNLQELVGSHAVQAIPDQPVGLRVGREFDHLDGIEQCTLSILGRLRPVRPIPGLRPPRDRAITIFLLVPPVDTLLDVARFLRIQVVSTVLLPPCRLPERPSGHQLPAVSGLEPWLHVLPQALPPAAERLFVGEPDVKLVPASQQGLVHHLGGLVTVFVTVDGQ